MEEEIWKKHPNFNEYEFSNFGNFRKADSKLILKNSIDNSSGYIITFLKPTGGNHTNRKRVRIHRLVAELFVENENPDEFKLINHIDGDKTNNHVSNLEWSNNLLNIQHAIDTGLRKYSQAQKLSISEVISIREEYDSTNIRYNDLASKYNINRNGLLGILKYKYYSRIQPERKMSFKINYLTGNDYLNWIKTKDKNSKKFLS